MTLSEYESRLRRRALNVLMGVMVRGTIGGTFLLGAIGFVGVMALRPTWLSRQATLPQVISGSLLMSVPAVAGLAIGAVLPLVMAARRRCRRRGRVRTLMLMGPIRTTPKPSASTRALYWAMGFRPGDNDEANAMLTARAARLARRSMGIDAKS